MPLGSFLRRSLSGLVVVAVACPAMGRADDSLIDYHEFYGTFSMENRWFPESPAHAGQSDAGWEVYARMAVADLPVPRPHILVQGPEDMDEALAETLKRTGLHTVVSRPGGTA